MPVGVWKRSQTSRNWVNWWFGAAAGMLAIVAGFGVAAHNVLLMAGIGLVALTLVLPVEVPLGLFALLVPFESVLPLGGTGISLVRIAGAFAGAMLLAYGILSGRLRTPPRPALWWGLFVLWSVISVTWAVDRHRGLQSLTTAVSLFALYLVTVSFAISRRELSRILWLLIAGGASASAVLIYEFIHVYGGRTRPTIVVGDAYSNANDLAGALLLPFAFALAGIFSRGTLLKRAALLGALALITLGVLLTMSRGGLFALTVVMLAYFLSAGRWKRLLLPVVVIALALLFMPRVFFTRWEQAPSGRGTGRLDIWIVGLHVVERSPLIGVGLGSFPAAYQDFAGYAPVFRGYSYNSHNMFLSVWAETGLVGFVLFLAANWSQMRHLRHALTDRHVEDQVGIAVQAAFLGLLVQGFDGNIEWSKSVWLGSMLVAVITQQLRRNRREVPALEATLNVRRVQRPTEFIA